MDRSTRRKLEMAHRVVKFSRDHPSPPASYATLLARLEDRLNRAVTLEAQQRAGQLDVRAANARRQDLRREIHTKFLPHLVRAAEQVAKEQPAVGGRFRLRAPNATHRAFLASTKAMLAEAVAQKELFDRNGLVPELLDELAKVLGDLETATAHAAAGKGQHIGARAGLQQAMAEVLEVIRQLDGLNRFRFRKDQELQAEWDGLRGVFGPDQSRVTNEGEGKRGDVPPPSGGIAPAA